jgi:dihydrofolate reductase
MAKLIYLTNVSVDGYIEDAQGGFDFGQDDDVFAFTTDLLASVGTLLYGRRLYEAMAVWETMPALAEQSALTARFAAAWHEPDKVVYSSTLTEPSTVKTRVDARFDPKAVRDMKAAATRDLLIGGADIAAQAFAEGLVDECHLIVWPLLVGGGKPGLPPGVRVGLDLLDERRFANGTVYLRYGVAT